LGKTERLCRINEIKKKKKNILIKIIKSKVKITYLKKKNTKENHIRESQALVEVIMYLQNINTKKY
jgi:hypothetical protein